MLTLFESFFPIHLFSRVQYRPRFFSISVSFSLGRQSEKDRDIGHLDAHVKILRSDRGGLYLVKESILYLMSKGTTQKLTIHDNPLHNGVAEHRNHTIVERICTLLHASGLPKTLWGEAAHHIVWLLNRTTTKAVDGKTLYEAAFGKKPDLRHVREWGEVEINWVDG